MKATARTSLAAGIALPLAGCAGGSAPTFPLFGAYFPGWLLCAVIGVAAAILARLLFVATGLHDVLPGQLLACTAIGMIVATLLWLLFLG